MLGKRNTTNSEYRVWSDRNTENGTQGREEMCTETLGEKRYTWCYNIIVRVVRSSTTDSPWFLYVEVLRRGSGVVLTERCVGIVMLFFKSRCL